MPVPPLLRFTVNHCRFLLLLVDGGPFRMGNDKASDPDAWDDEAPPHDVTVPAFYLAEYPVTQTLWQAVMGEENAPSFFSGGSRPVEQVSWEDAQVFLESLNRQTGVAFRLPTEAEWEYAARGGVCQAGGKFAGSQRLKEVGWYEMNSHGETKPVGRKFPNELGLYDMSGNVWEWCEDQWHGNYNDAPDDGSAWVDREQGSYRVHRGGSWLSAPRGCRAAFRLYWLPDHRHHFLGFRLALSLQAVGSRPAGL
ncbi:MAG: formylglycine-generating enzyme family protein [Saprospirales bacterium]|jgi:sulfatase modifying factor 1|nr:formylglycine-generating enzyme family protein [Saprospirales bacterium]